MPEQSAARLIAFYLPQFHPIPENDEWWGKGFTEWTNVAKARPLFKGHYQPRVPADLGFYDLRVPEVRAAQAELASQHGIEAFCYWHYWFAGKRMLELPFREVVESGKPDFPFCLAWANESWTGIWEGNPNRVLIEQTYPGEEDNARHFQALLPAFRDERYLRVDDKPLFVVYQPSRLPNALGFTSLWNELAIKADLKGMYFVGISDYPWAQTPGFDGYTYHLPGTFVEAMPGRKRLRGHALNKFLRGNSNSPLMIDYPSLIKEALGRIKFTSNQYPSVLPNWDSTPRHGLKGLVLNDSTPGLFRTHLREAIDIVGARDFDQRLIFIKSWNEWAEGNYVEPDLGFGKEYLEVIRDEVSRVRSN